MKKLIILKSLIDFIWTITLIPTIIIIPILGVLLCMDSEIFKTISILPFNVSDSIPLIPKILIIFLFICYLLVIYGIYLFRKTLRYFAKNKPFDKMVIKGFYKIGCLFSIAGIFSSILIFIIRLLIESKFQLQLGISFYLTLICLGLFFMVLSELFRVSKEYKEENDLTI
jgi:hypothetical protein